ncbi:MAG TPA: DsrE family protein [Rhodocyclaceae bacterium]|nr:DsrE family protein [Rhodocyclaceae bacterium]
MSAIRFLRRLALLLLFTTGIAFADSPIKVVYQFSDGLEQASRGLRNIQNHLNAEPNVKIVAVGYGPGIDFMLDGAKDKNGATYETTIADLAMKGVEFRVCNNTLQSRKIDPAKVDQDARIVPSGVAEIGRLQAKEGFVYLKP